MSASQPTYFARVTAGTAALAWGEIAAALDAACVSSDARTIVFTTAAPPARLTLLGSVDDVYISLGELPGLDHTHPSLARFAEHARGLAWRKAEATVRQVRALPDVPEYTITASLGASANYSRYDAADSLQQALAGTLPWRYVDQRSTSAACDLDVRVLLEPPRALLGLRLAQEPLHRRAYKLASVPGSLKVPVAYCMLMLANPRPGHTLADLLCGAGTILLEAETNWDPGQLVGSDHDPAAIAAACANAQNARASAEWLLADAAALPCSDGALAAVCSNLPWGRQVQLADSPAFHTALAAELVRTLTPFGRAVLLTDQIESLLEACAAQGSLQLALAQPISLYGSHPSICVFIKQRRPLGPLRPFARWHDEDQAMGEVVRSALLGCLAHPYAPLRLRALRACARSSERTLLEAAAAFAQDRDAHIRDLAAAARERLARSEQG